jgi:hypothetical protein
VCAIKNLQYLLAQLPLVLGPRGIVPAGPIDHACESVLVKIHGGIP